MSKPTVTPQKRPRPDSTSGVALNEMEHRIYQLILSKKDMGIWSGNIKRDIGDVPANVITKVVKSLQTKQLVKLVTDINSKAKKRLMGMKFEPAKELSGGSWYADDGRLDTQFVDLLRAHCLEHIKSFKGATIESMHKSIEKSSVFAVKITQQQIDELVRVMVIDGQVAEEKSARRGGMPTYKFVTGKDEPKEGTFTSIPCGVCPRINECTPDGIISPQNCVYYSKWLGLDF